MTSNSKKLRKFLSTWVLRTKFFWLPIQITPSISSYKRERENYVMHPADHVQNKIFMLASGLGLWKTGRKKNSKNVLGKIMPFMPFILFMLFMQQPENSFSVNTTLPLLFALQFRTTFWRLSKEKPNVRRIYGRKTICDWYLNLLRSFFFARALLLLY